jgi:hypothetical protein
MKTNYENFAKIDYSNYDANNCSCYFPYEHTPYSKVIVQFEDNFNLKNREKTYDELSEFVGGRYNADYERNQYIYYTNDSDAFDDIVKFFSNYKCNTYQLIFNAQDVSVGDFFNLK